MDNLISNIIDFYSNHNSTYVSEIELFDYLGLKSYMRDYFYKNFIGSFHNSGDKILVVKIIPDVDNGGSHITFYLNKEYSLIVERQKKINGILNYENR